MTPILPRLWLRAAASEFGIRIATKQVKTLRNDLYRVREQMKNPALQDLTLALVRPGEIWIVRNTVELD